MAGRGVVSSGVTPSLVDLAERADLPVVTTLLGLDGFPSSHPLALGLPGMHGTERANRAIQEADVILGLGLRFDDRVIGRPDRFAPHAHIVHADISPASVGRTVRVDVRLVGDLAHTLPALARRIAPGRRAEWWSRLEEWRRDPEAVEEWEIPADAPLGGRVACRMLAHRIGAAGAIVVTDVGQHQMWIAQELPPAAPGTHLTSGGLGTMGYALPAAIGAALARPDRPVWVVAGDGGFQMSLHELATVVDHRLRLRIAVVNNGFLGMVRQWQELFYERRYAASELGGPDLTLLARAYGIPARAVTSAGELPAALDWAEQVSGPVLLDLQVAREENVYPMVPAGAALDELVTGPVPGASAASAASVAS
jgi:acetolactate synthase-1/2/3 large subunit